jgi:uncharacterized BrkB/YihY/UPF0761 family membrane protein
MAADARGQPAGRDRDARRAATAAGLLVYLYVFHQLLLLGAAWAATADHGRVVDLAAGSPPDES